MTNLNTSQEWEPDSFPLQCLPSPPRRILVVEDDADIRRLNAELLLRSGFEVEAVEDGAAAWDALCTDSYDLMITDNHMPRLTGLDLLKKLYATRLTLPVIMATGEMPAHQFAPSPWLRPEAVLLKPYTPAELLRTVKEILRTTDGARAPIAPPDSADGLQPG